ncbi:MAG: NUDIX hydrolase [Candidatus Paceibacterota bacterium]
MNTFSNRGVVFVLVRDNKILMQQRDGNCKKFPFRWCIPGGECEDGEEYETALLREIKEEYDFDLKIDDCSFVMDYKNGADKVYICNVSHDQEPKLGEGLSMKWMSFEEIENLDLGFNQAAMIPVLKKFLLAK